MALPQKDEASALGRDLSGIDLDVVYRAASGIEAWQKLQAKQNVPDLWPYGLDHLRSEFSTVNAYDLSELSKMQAAWAAVKTMSLRRKLNSVAVCWDERTALRMAYQQPTARMYSGVIWATDDRSRGENKIATALTRSALRKFEAVWCLSSAQVRPTAEWLRFDLERVHRVHFGVDSDFFRYHDPLPDSKLIVSFGVDRDRDPMTLFAALDLVIKERPDVHAIIQTTSQAIPPKGVRVIGRVAHSQVRDLYRQSAAVAVATRDNLHASGMTVALEAMSSGRPIVISNTPGMDEYVNGRSAGRLTGPGDADQMASELLGILADRDLRREMGFNGRRQIEENFNSKAMASRIARLINT